MKICALIPSDEYRHQAGVRIRYQRIEAPLRALGHELTVRLIEEAADPRQIDSDVYLISKCHDVRALLVAQMLVQQGKRLGVDLFDDYYSQQDDPRLARLRGWLAALRPLLDFALCSTPAFSDLAGRLLPGLPCHVMNDPAPPVAREQLVATLQAKLDVLRRTRVLDLAWFGVGDNPRFPVGLSDLAAFGGLLARLRGRGFDVHLNVLTNRRALTVEALERLRRLPLPFHIEEWSQDKEGKLLAESYACFLPVNAQNFSIVKSLNRAGTALTTGTQVLSAGYPLYEALADFVYRDPLHLIDDAVAGHPLLRADTVDALQTLLARWAGTEHEASAWATFLDGLPDARSTTITAASPVKSTALVAVIHGRASSDAMHKFAHTAGALSVASPFCALKADFDLTFRFEADGPGLELLIAERRLDLLPIEERVCAIALDSAAHEQQAVWRLALPALRQAGANKALRAAPLGYVPLYASVMHAVRQCLRQLFPGLDCYMSETSDLPWFAEEAFGGNLH